MRDQDAHNPSYMIHVGARYFREETKIYTTIRLLKFGGKGMGTLEKKEKDEMKRIGEFN